MAAPGQDQPGPGGLRPADPMGVLNAQLDAAQVAASKSAGATSAAEARDFAQASLLLAQAITTLDPNRLQGGDTAAARVAATPPPVPLKDGDRDGKVGEK